MSRPEKEIDWKKVDELLIAGCLGTEIAPHFNMHPETFYRRVEEKYGMGFTKYSSEKKSHGESLLRAHQYAKALGLTDKGDNTLLIWLGKNRLKQKENPDQVEFNNQIAEKFDSVMNLLSKSQEADSSLELNIADSNINNADKSMLDTGEVNA